MGAYRTGSCGSSEVNWAKMEPGGLGQLFRLLLGPRRGPEGGQDGPHQQPNRDHDQWPPNERAVRDEAELYKVFTNPLEMNRFFEEQMDEMLRNFGQGFFGGDLRSGPPGSWGGQLQPALPQHPQEENGSKRDLMLRDPHSSMVPDTPAIAQPLKDEDLSDNWQSLLGEIRMPGKQGQLFGSEEESRSGCIPSERGLGGLFGNRGFGGGAFDFGNHQGLGLEQSPGGGGGGGVKFFSSSVSESTVRGPDGGLETTRTVRSSDGREEVTVTKRLADGSSTTETRVTGGGKLAGEGTSTALDGGWTVVPRGGMSVPGPRDEMLGQNPESVLGDLWQTFFGK